MGDIMDNQSLNELTNMSEQVIELNKYKLLNLNADEKERYVDRLVVTYPLMKNILLDMEECKASSRRLNEIKCMFIAGNSRHGKTTITGIFRRNNSDIITEEITLKPILYVRFPAPAYTGSLKSAVLKALGDPFYAKTLRNYQSDDRIYNLLEKCKVQLIIFDEFQHLVEGNRHRVLKDSSDWVKNLIDDCKVSVVFTGLPYSENVLIENEQLGNRVRIRHTLTSFGFNDKEFRIILDKFDKELPFKEKSDLAQDGNWQRIYLATGGTIGHVKSLLRAATRMAALEDLPYVSEDILFNAYSKELSFLSTNNPFSPTFNLRKAIKEKGYDR